MTKLRLAPHSGHNRMIVEIWQDGEMIGAIYPLEDGVRIMSKYFATTQNAVFDTADPRTLDVHIRESRK